MQCILHTADVVVIATAIVRAKKHAAYAIDGMTLHGMACLDDVAIVAVADDNKEISINHFSSLSSQKFPT